MHHKKNPSLPRLPNANEKNELDSKMKHDLEDVTTADQLTGGITEETFSLGDFF